MDFYSYEYYCTWAFSLKKLKNSFRKLLLFIIYNFIYLDVSDNKGRTDFHR